jgi:hypothetical protein
VEGGEEQNRNADSALRKGTMREREREREKGRNMEGFAVLIMW